MPERMGMRFNNPPHPVFSVTVRCAVLSRHSATTRGNNSSDEKYATFESDSENEHRDVDRVPVWGAGGPWGSGNTGGAMSMTMGLPAKSEGLIADEDGTYFKLVKSA